MISETLMATVDSSDTRAPADAGPLYPPTVEPMAQPLGLPRTLTLFVRNPLRALPRQVYEEPIVFPLGRNPRMAWVTDPALVEQILVGSHEQFPKSHLEARVFRRSLGQGILTSSGPRWRWQRRTAAPLFRAQDTLRYVPVMARAAEELVERWRAGSAGQVQPIERLMSEVTFAVISRTMLDGDVAEGQEIQDAIAEMLERITWEVAASLLGLPVWVWHPGKSRMHRGAARVRRAVGAIVQRRRATGGAHDDLLGRLMAARDPETNAGMSDEVLVDNLVTLLAAGHETTAKALTWTLYLLARAPEWQAAVRDEVLRVASSGPITARHVASLALTTQVVKEAIRLYPPAPVLTRVAAEQIDLGGWRIGAGLLFVMPIFAIHRHRRLWADPDRFDPSRFEPTREAKLPRTQYMPFGAGPRICMGAAFALTEATVMLATFIRGARFEWDGKHLPEPLSRVTLRPQGGMPLAVTPL